MRNFMRLSTIALVCAVVMAWCGVPGAQSAPITGLSEEVEAERMLQTLGRELALALNRAEVRAWLQEELRMSPYIEDRIAFNRALLSRPDLVEILGSPAIANRAAAIAELADLELYFPIDEHRDSWSGEAGLEVAVPIFNGDRFVVYAADGSYREVEADFEPATPTLLLAKSEIDYDDLSVALKGGSKTAGFLREEALQTDAGTTTSQPELWLQPRGVSPTNHTYLTYLQVTEWFEPPIKGDMEIEVFGAVNGVYGGCTRITNVEKNETIYLPPPNPTSPHRIAYAVPTGTTELDVDVYEDDDTGCSVRSGDDYIGSVGIRYSQYGSIWGVSGGYASVRVHASSNVCGDGSCQTPESCINCSADCGICQYCGNGFCEPNESCRCVDCGPCTCDYDDICESNEVGGNCEDCCDGGFCVE